MNIIEIIISSFALASDAFAVSISKGLSLNYLSYKKCILISSFFGISQGLMPLFGYLFGNIFNKFISSIDHFIAFFLLVFMGIKMMYDLYYKRECIDDGLNLYEIFLLAIATSIDAFSFGIAYSFSYSNNYILCFSIISIITFILCFIGIKIGSKIGYKFELISRVVGGLILILLGFNVLLDHLL